MIRLIYEGYQPSTSLESKIRNDFFKCKKKTNIKHIEVISKIAIFLLSFSMDIFDTKKKVR